MGNLKPLHDKIIVEKIERETISKGGILIPESAKEDVIVRGKVVAVGKGRTLDSGEILPLSVAPGDEVLFNVRKGAMTAVPMDKGNCFVIPEADVLAVVE